MSFQSDAHPDEDRLAAWVLDREEVLPEKDLVHVDGCPLCTRRLEALHQLRAALVDLELLESTKAEPSVPGGLSLPSLDRARRRVGPLRAATALVIAAVLAWIVPRITPTETVVRENRIDLSRVEDRTLELLTRLPAETADSLLALPAITSWEGWPTNEWVPPGLTALGGEERCALYQILQDRLTGKGPGATAVHGGGT